METLTLNELQKMMDDFMVIAKPGIRTEEEYQKANALKRNQIVIAKQLLTIHQGTTAITGRTSAAELEKMITDFETYWSDRRGRGDVEAENADALSYRIVEIAQELMDALKVEADSIRQGARLG